MKPNPPPFKIETGVPLPAGRRDTAEFIAALKKVKVATRSNEDQSFTWHENVVIYRTAIKNGFKIRTRKINGQGYRVWRIK